MLSKSFIRAYAGERIFRRGNDLYDNGNVTDLKTHKDNDTGVIHITGTVVSSHGNNLYEASAVLSADENWIIDCSCTCPYFEESMEPCKHIVAVLLAYINEDQETAAVSPAHHHSPERRTDRNLQNLIAKYVSAPALTEKEQPNGTVVLEPWLTISPESDSTLQVEFRIGIPGSHMYLISSISSFASHVHDEEDHKYGKALEFIHRMSAFAPSCRPLIRFLLSLVYDEDSYQDDSRGYSYYSYYTYTEPSIKRYLSLKGRYLDLFMDLFQDQGFHLSVIDGHVPGESEIYHLQDGQPAMQASLRKDGKGFFLSSGTQIYLKGYACVYFLDQKEHIVLRTGKDQKIMPLLDFMKQADGQEMYISENDLPSFSRYVFPLLAKEYKVAAPDYDPASYAPVRPDFEVYLDLPQDDLITGELFAVYPDERYNVLQGIQDNGKRDIESEQEMDHFMSGWFNSFDPEHARLALANDDDRTYAFLKEGIPALQEKAVVYISDKLKRLQVHEMPKVQIGISVSHDLLQLDLVSDDMSMKQLADILSRYDRRKKFFRLKNGDFVDLDETMNELADLTDSLSLSGKDLADGSVSVPKFRAMALDEFGDDSQLQFSRDQTFRNLIANMKDINSRSYELPADLHADLRSYQKEGFRWLCALRDNGFGGLLADEMGLGKTLQVIAVLGAWKNRGRTLIVCPASLVYNWSSEIHKFMPTLSSRMIQGTAEMRSELIKASREDDILITSYDLLKRDLKSYEGMHFSCEVIDEAQYIKNANTQASRAVKRIDAGFRIALTGTPIENRLSELWSIFDYLMPGFFYGYAKFRDTFERPIVNDKDEDVQNKLRRMITPFVLRRLKKDVLKDLPAKLEEVWYAPLEGEQKELYDARVQRLKMMLEKQSDQEFKESKILVLAELTRLRQLCCDPGLIYEKYKGNSAKEDMAIDMIRNAVEGGHKILLFSQFTSMLDTLVKRLQKEGIACHLLEGSTPKKTRAEMVEAFQTDDTPVFCISLKAGGTGLNLTAADIVIHYDPWWNTAVENQASDRAHRIGQKNTVSVYRLIMKDTVEERILALQEEKSDLAGRILSGEGISSAKLSREDLLSIL